MDKRIKICKEEAEKQIQAFKDNCGFEDPKEIVSGESSIPEEYRILFLSGVMTGVIEFREDFKRIAVNLRAPIKTKDGDISEISVQPHRIKQHEVRGIKAKLAEQAKSSKTEVDEGDVLEKTGQKLFELSDYVLSEMCTKDTQAMTAVTVHLVFI